MSDWSNGPQCSIVVTPELVTHSDIFEYAIQCERIMYVANSTHRAKIIAILFLPKLTAESSEGGKISNCSDIFVIVEIDKSRDIRF